MEIQIGTCTVQVDTAATLAYYGRFPADTFGCDCAGCRNFVKAAGCLPEELRRLLKQLGLDPARPVHLTPLVAAENGAMICYDGWYHLCGTMTVPAATLQVPEVTFNQNCRLLRKDFPRPAIQLDFTAVVPWVLDEPNTYG